MIEHDKEPHAQVLLLGVYHFHNPGLDVVQVDVADVLSPEKQTEIQEIIQTLRRFQPTKIAVEALPEQADRLHGLYSDYRAGQHELGRSEIQQLGFRLAHEFDHPRLYPIDHEGEFPFEEMMAYAQEHDAAFVNRVQTMIGQSAATETRWQQENGIGQILRLMNDPAQIAVDHGLYMDFARVGAGDGYVGARLLSNWYERNIHIFANLKRIVEPGDRLLLIFGVGHAAILRELISYDPNLELIEAHDYLPA